MQMMIGKKLVAVLVFVSLVTLCFTAVEKRNPKESLEAGSQQSNGRLESPTKLKVMKEQAKVDKAAKQANTDDVKESNATKNMASESKHKKPSMTEEALAAEKAASKQPIRDKEALSPPTSKTTDKQPSKASSPTKKEKAPQGPKKPVGGKKDQLGRQGRQMPSGPIKKETQRAHAASATPKVEAALEAFGFDQVIDMNKAGVMTQSINCSGGKCHTVSLGPLLSLTHAPVSVPGPTWPTAVSKGPASSGRPSTATSQSMTTTAPIVASTSASSSTVRTSSRSKTTTTFTSTIEPTTTSMEAGAAGLGISSPALVALLLVAVAFIQ